MKMRKIDRRLIDRILDDVYPSGVIADIGTYILVRNPEDAEFGLTRPAMNLLMYLMYTGEVGNGGHFQYFWNPSGAYAARTLEALGEMGLSSLQAILLEAISVFPGSTISAVQSGRICVIQELPEPFELVWDGLDKQLWSLREDCDANVVSCLRENRGLLLQQETA